MEDDRESASQAEDDSDVDGKAKMGSEHSDVSLSDHEVNRRPVRKRRPWKKHVVVHDYHDHLNDPIRSPLQGERQIGSLPDQILEPVSGLKHPPSTISAIGVSIDHVSFPEKIHYMLHRMEKEGLEHVVCWKIHGRSFVVGNKKEFIENVVPRYGNGFCGCALHRTASSPN
jgi:HSF-type DNA-binding